MKDREHYPTQDRPVLAPALPDTIWLELASLPHQPGRFVILRKKDNEEEVAVWKRSRRFENGRWQPYEVWLSVKTKAPLDFEAQAWRPWP